MKTTRDAFVSYLTSSLQPELFRDIFLNGVIVEGADVIHSFAVAVSSSLATIEKAVAAEVDFLITHHGFIFTSTGEPISGSLKKKIALLLENDITLATYHLPLDMHKEYGNCFPVARMLGATSLEPFVVHKEEVGVKANIPIISRDELKRKLEILYAHPAAVAFGGKETVSSIAIISGRGHKFLKDAAEQSIDAFITRSFDEASWNEAFDEGCNFFACGHSATEIIGVRLLAEHLSQKFSIPHFILKDNNPF